MRVLFIATNPSIREASTRYRVTAYFDALRAAGHTPVLSTFFDDQLGGRIGRYAGGFIHRFRDAVRAGSFDLVFIHRELLPLAWNYGLHIVGRRPLVFDYDDAVFLASDTSWRGRLALPASTRRLIDASSLVLAGNPYLADYARETNPNTEVLPTVVDTEVYRPETRESKEVPLVGWIGSPSTAKYLAPLLPILDELGKSFRFRMLVVGAGREIRLHNVEVSSPPWSATTEAEQFRKLDIGVYPLADDLWAKGKCGFKAIQYMASGVPSVVAPVGVVRDIARPGIDALWAESPEQWRDGLAALLESPSQRETMAMAARQRAVEAWSLAATTPRFIAALEQAARR